MASEASLCVCVSENIFRLEVVSIDDSGKSRIEISGSELHATLLTGQHSESSVKLDRYLQ